MTERPEVASEFDVIVIGGGPVGENAADRAHKAGLSVVLVERHLLGGECSFYACSPSKALLRPIHATRASQRVQGSVGARLDPEGVLARRDAWINRIGTSDDFDDSGQVGWLDHVGIRLVRGEGRLVGERLVEVGERTLHARYAVILATGSAPLVPDIPGLREARPWTNRDATTSQRLPERLAVIGGGVVACELAQVYAALGSSVTVVARSPRLLTRAEPFAGEAVAEALRRDGVDLRLGVQATAVSRLGTTGVVTLDLDDGTGLRADEVLVAAGRTPSTEGLGLESVGALTDDDGFVVVSERMEVSGVEGRHPWLYAVGDVNGRNLLTHMGKYQGRVCGDVIAARAKGLPDDGPALRDTADDRGAPQAIFTDPQVCMAGLTESKARADGFTVRAVEYDMGAVPGAALQADGYTGRAKAVVDEDRRVLLGVTFVGLAIVEHLYAATLAVTAEIPLDQLWHAVPAFPTTSEIWLRLLQAYGL